MTEKEAIYGHKNEKYKNKKCFLLILCELDKKREN